MSSVTLERWRSYRSQTQALVRGQPIRSAEEAVLFVQRRGFVFFWPIKDVDLPSLWSAVAGDRPVPNDHDDPGHITWGWKDSLLGQRRWYYAKVLRKKATLIALGVAPYFYALSENYGEPEVDYLLQYQEGRLSHEAKLVYEVLLAEGPLHTIDLRKKAHLASEASNAPYNRAMDQLQVDFKLLPVGVAEAGAWRYAFVWDLVHRHYPELPAQARPIRQRAARRSLAELYLRSVGVAQGRDLVKLFGWTHQEADQARQDLVAAGAAQPVTMEGRPGDSVALPELLRRLPAL